jgi:hypothetical protein
MRSVCQLTNPLTEMKVHEQKLTSVFSLTDPEWKTGETIKET